MTPLRQRMLQDMGIRNLALNTQLAYVQQISAFARHFDCSPEALGPEQIRAYQVHLIEERKLAAGSLSVVAAALRFLYKITLRRPWNDDDIPMPKRPLKLPIVLSPEEVVRFLACVASTKHRAILTTIYASGLRVSEAVALRPADIDSSRMVLRVDQGTVPNVRLEAMPKQPLRGASRASSRPQWQAYASLEDVPCPPPSCRSTERTLQEAVRSQQLKDQVCVDGRPAASH